MFQEVKSSQAGQGWEKIGALMVAKEARYIQGRESKEKFHTVFCSVQHKASELAKLFNQAVDKAPLLKPSNDETSVPPPIFFLKCSVYEYLNTNGRRCGLLVERYLRGKFTKFNSNNGFALTNRKGDITPPSIDLMVGEVLLTDVVQAFSHWVYEYTERELIVCDLQGVLDMEGRRPTFLLTDPAICSKNRGSSKRRFYYGKTDLGMRGIRNFCRRHTCNDVCKALDLPPAWGRRQGVPRESVNLV
jgi:hypothetical protein